MLSNSVIGDCAEVEQFPFRIMYYSPGFNHRNALSRMEISVQCFQVKMDEIVAVEDA